MDCQPSSDNSVSDKLEIQFERRSSVASANAWLIQKGINYLNSADKEAEVSYKYVIELLTRNEASDTIVQLIRTVSQVDVTARWSLLYLLGDIGDRQPAKWLAQFSVEPLPKRGEGCEGPRDGELLLRTMAIESLKKIAVRNSETSEYVLKVISEHPDRAVLIEAVKAAVELGLKQKVYEILPKEDHWMLDIRKVRAEEIHADPERADTKERNFTPPKMISEYTSPSTKCGCKKGGTHNG